MEWIVQGAALIISVAAAVVIHEVAHGYAALYFGDQTAKLMGRLTLNPIAHIHWFGTIVMPVTIYFFSMLSTGHGFFFAFAKPVPVAFHRLRNPKKDMVWVAAAGPGINIALATGAAGLVRALEWMAPESFAEFSKMFQGSAMDLTSSPINIVFFILLASVYVNIVLAIINLIPVPPADGGRIVMGLLPDDTAASFAKIEPYGLGILILILFYNPLNIINWTIHPVIEGLANLLLN